MTNIIERGECVECGNCHYKNSSDKIDTLNIKEVFEGTDTSCGEFNVYSIFGLCRRCNQHTLFLKSRTRKPGIVKMRQSRDFQEILHYLDK